MTACLVAVFVSPVGDASDSRVAETGVVEYNDNDWHPSREVL